jgi:hypothetical protein
VGRGEAPPAATAAEAESRGRAVSAKHRPWYSWRRWPGRILLGGLAVAVVLGILDSLACQDEAREHQTILAELDEQFPAGWRMEQLTARRPTPPPEQNAARALSVLRQQLPDDWPGVSLRELILKGEPLLRPDPDQLAELRQAVAEARPSLDLVRGFAPPARGRLVIEWQADVINTRLDDFQTMRLVLWLLAADALLRAEGGDANGALADCRDAWFATRWLRDEPGMLMQLVRMACSEVAGRAIERTLAQSPNPSAAALAELCQLTTEDELVRPFPLAVAGDLAAFHLFFDNAAAGRTDFTHFAYERPARPWERVLEAPYTRYRLRRTQAFVSRFLARAAAIDRLPTYQQTDAARAMVAELRAADTSLIAVRVGSLIIPAFDKVLNAALRHHAWQRSLSCIMAAEQFRLANGRLPRSLDELTPAFLAAVPIDPFDGKPLRYRNDAGCFTVYSVGPDRTDDGGRLSRDYTETPGADFGYRLWDVAKRRQPPPPAPPKAEEEP